MYLHGERVFHQHRSELPVELKEDLPLAGLVQVSEGKRLDVQRLSSLQLHLRWRERRGSEQDWVQMEKVNLTWELDSQVQLEG